MDIRLRSTPVLAIVGRPNVGKSTLFNRLCGKKKAIVSPVPGTTTDINFCLSHWRGMAMTAIDTAGVDMTSARATGLQLLRQADAAMKKADVILFLVDAETGLMPQDRALAKKLFRSKKPVLLAANKCDNAAARTAAADPSWKKLGFGAAIPISAVNGSGVGDLLDEVIASFSKEGADMRPIPEPDITIAIIGRPNVGKSSLLNALAGEERVIVSEVPHTTKEPQDTLLTFTQDGREIHALLIDTVGIRKKARVEPGMEKLGVHLSIRAIEEADVIFLMIDAAQGVGLQEKKLADLLSEKKPGILLVVNKWDLAEGGAISTAAEYQQYLKRELPFLLWADAVFIAASSGRGVGKLIARALDIKRERERRLDADVLDRFSETLKKMHHAAIVKGKKRPKVHGIVQTGITPPSFMLIVDDKETIHQNFLRFAEKRLRGEFGFRGTPIRVAARELKK